MKAKILIAALAVSAVAGSAFAGQTYPYVTFTDQASTVNRAAVQTTAALPQGQQETIAPDAGFVPTKTRAQVNEELRQAQQDGSYRLAGQEYDGQFPALRGAPQRLASN